MRGYSTRLRRLERVFSGGGEWQPPLPFAEFCQQAWPVIDSAHLVWSWHLDELCDSLSDAAHRRHRGEAVELAIAAPPGSSKSRPVSILFQPWVWTWWPGSAWITTSWDESLAYKFSEFSKDLVGSPWYQARWPMGIRGGTSRWKNRFGGIRYAYGVRSRVTGDHGHFILGDDLLKEQLVRDASPGQIADAVAVASGFWYGTLGTRAIDHIACKIAVGQLLHVDDPVTVAIRDRHYERLVYPVTFEANHKWRSERDRRTEEGEMLCPRINQEKIDKIVLDIGPTAAAAQLWQRPEPLGGQLLKAEYMTHRWTSLPQELRRAMESAVPGAGQRWIITGDMNFKSKRQSKRRKGPDWVVYELWCALAEKRYLIDQVRGQWGYREAKLQLALFGIRHMVAPKIILEDAANASAVEDDLTEGGLTEADLFKALELEGVEKPPSWTPIIKLEPHGGGTLARTQASEGTWYNGHVILPLGPRWVDEQGGFVDEHTRYSGVEGETDDQVSCSSLAIVHLKQATSRFTRAMSNLRR